MYKRLVDDALRSGAIVEHELAGFTDEGLLHRLDERAPSASNFHRSLVRPPTTRARLSEPASRLKEPC